jgi:D-galacturonate reductase
MGCDPRTEDTITLLVDWVKVDDESKRGTAVYTASWAAPLKAGVHSEQYFHCMFAEGEVRINQARRGYSIVEDDIGTTNYNPFYMKYSPDEDGFFDAQRGYGYISFEKFIDAARRVNAGTNSAADFEGKGLPTIKDTVLTTAILQAGRISLDDKRSVEIVQEGDKWKLK